MKNVTLAKGKVVGFAALLLLFLFQSCRKDRGITISDEPNLKPNEQIKFKDIAKHIAGNKVMELLTLDWSKA